MVCHRIQIFGSYENVQALRDISNPKVRVPVTSLGLGNSYLNECIIQNLEVLVLAVSHVWLPFITYKHNSSQPPGRAPVPEKHLAY